MSSPSFIDLLRWELRSTGRSKLLWIVLATVTAAFVWGSQSTRALHRSQIEAQARTLESDAAWMADVRRRAAQYAQPAATVVPYWQDPTDVSGFSRYFLRQHALKPHLPLSTLAAGESALLPSRLPVKLDTLFGIEPLYDFEPPRGLALGPFDLGFAIAYLLPVALILLMSLLATYERDRRILTLIAAQSVHPRIWLSARFAAMTVYVLPGVLFSLIVALWVSGASISQGLPELGAAIALVGSYTLFWLALGFVVMTLWPGAAGAFGALLTLWALLTLAIPLLANMSVSWMAPMPSRIEYIDARRQVDDAVPADRDAIITAGLRNQADPETIAARIPSLDYATQRTFLTPETERRLASRQAEIQTAQIRQQQISHRMGFVVPALGVDSALAVLAGTDAHRHRRFEEQTRAYQLLLRETFYPLVHRQIFEPATTLTTRGRLNFTRYDIVPAFRMVDEPAAKRVAAVLPVAGWLLVVGALLAVIALMRLRDWPTER
jgi:ABC-2 type transport system permease protein